MPGVAWRTRAGQGSGAASHVGRAVVRLACELALLLIKCKVERQSGGRGISGVTDGGGGFGLTVVVGV